MMAIAACELGEISGVSGQCSALLDLVECAARGGDLASQPLIQVLEAGSGRGEAFGRNGAFIPVTRVVGDERIEFKDQPRMASGDQIVIHIEDSIAYAFGAQMA